MSTNPSRTVSHIDTASVAEAARLRDRFAAAWENVTGPDAVVELDDFLPTADPMRAIVLRSLIPLDLDSRWKRGHPARLEQYIVRYPELGSPADVPVSIVVAEYVARQQYGDRPTIDDYAERFPHAVAELRRLQAERTPPVDVGTGTMTLSQGAAEFLATLSSPDGSSFGSPPTVTSRPGAGGNGLSGDPTDAGFAVGTNLAPPDQGYKLGEKLGAGAFGEVRRAEAPGGVDVALKIIFRPLSHAAAQQELSSLELIKKLRHPYLLQTHAYWSLQDRLMIVMEMADGTLKDRKGMCVADGCPGVPPAELLGYLREAAEAIDYLHAQGIQHRDIKPANILLVGKHIKIADFGLAQLRPTPGNPSESGGRSGTPGFMAPEVWRGNPGPEADQYALAISYVESRLGRLPFAGKTMLEQMNAHMLAEPNLEGLEPAEAAVVGRALAKKPETRYATCAEFAAALADALAPVIPPPRIPRWKRYTAIGVVLAAAMIAVAVTVFRPSPEPIPTEPWLPADSHPDDGAETTIVNERLFYNRIVLDRGGQDVTFVLVPPTILDHPPTFYIMEDMVWNDLFRAAWDDKEYQAELARLATDHPWVTRNEWTRGGEKDEDDAGVGDPRMPVFRVTVTEAYCCAHWLGGQLPTREQWLRAAGKDGSADRPGPADPDCRGGIAVDRFTLGPAPVGTSLCDVSPFGVRDMAGNGMEWTRTTLDLIGGKSVPVAEPSQDTTVFILGQSYTRPEPYQFADAPQSELYDAISPTIGFRAVLEP